MNQLILGVGLTGACNYNCGHCYSKAERSEVLPIETLERFLAKGIVRSVNLGTGESCLHPDFERILCAIEERGIPVGLTTNGTSVIRLSRRALERLNDVDFSLDFPTRELHDAHRQSGAFQNVLEGIRRCQEAGVECSIAMCLSKKNKDYLWEMLQLCDRLCLNLRVNIYKGCDAAYVMEPDEFWTAMDQLLGHSFLISCGEPTVVPLLGRRSLSQASSEGLPVRLRPDGRLLPCVYWEGSGVPVEQYLDWDGEDILRSLTALLGQERKHIPAGCAGCSALPLCGGGCSCRRQYTGLDARDPYCMYETDPPELDVQFIEGGELVHANYLCTTIVRGVR